MTPYTSRLGNDGEALASIKTSYGPDGDDSTTEAEDEDSTELATLHLLSKCSTKSCSNQESY